MGCDIHVLAQRMDKDTKEWSTFCEIFIPRDYQLFGLMGLEHRSDVKPVVPLRGAPDEEAEISLRGHNAEHSFSWCSYQEFLSVIKEYSNLNPNGYNFFKSHFYLIIDVLKSLAFKKGESRLLYGFDS